jgi:hypothetical protein
LLVAVAAAGCGSSHQQGASPSVGAADRQACAQLFARLQQVSTTIQGSSELIANSIDKQQLAQRIAYEQAQLQQAADLMSHGPIPAALQDADRDLVDALRKFTADFERAREPAARGDFQAAAAAMHDPDAVQRVVAAAKTIEDACK